jgi:hypothetical protein
MSDQATFEHSAGFERGETSGDLRLGKLEMMYEELFAEVIEDGIITQDERAKLDKMAENLGLDRGRLRKLESALQAAWEGRHKVVIKEMYETEEDRAGPVASIEPLQPVTDQRTLALQRRIHALEGRIAELERDLEEARSQVTVEVDVSDFSNKPVPDDDPVELQRRLRHDPRDEHSLHSLYRVYEKKNDADRQWCIAQALVYLKAASSDEKTFWDKHRVVGLIQPKMALTADAWTKLLLHPDQEPVIGDIFAVVTPAVLLGRLSALRRDKQLEKLDAAQKQDPAVSTIQAVRCFAWASAILGMNAPPIFVQPDWEGTCQMVPAMPPAMKLGHLALSGRSAAELAFLAGRQLAFHREHHFVRILIPSVQDIEDVFLAAISIGNPGLPMNERMKTLVVPIAKAIEPILEPAAVDRLRGHFLRFVEEGGRTNLGRWATACDRTATRAGLLLANDLQAAHKIIEVEDKAHIEEKMDDLLTFTTSDRYARLRKQLGIALASAAN